MGEGDCIGSGECSADPAEQVRRPRHEHGVRAGGAGCLCRLRAGTVRVGQPGEAKEEGGATSNRHDPGAIRSRKPDDRDVRVEYGTDEAGATEGDTVAGEGECVMKLIIALAFAYAIQKLIDLWPFDTSKYDPATQHAIMKSRV